MLYHFHTAVSAAAAELGRLLLLQAPSLQLLNGGSFRQSTCLVFFSNAADLAAAFTLIFEVNDPELPPSCDLPTFVSPAAVAAETDGRPSRRAVTLHLCISENQVTAARLSSQPLLHVWNGKITGKFSKSLWHSQRGKKENCA